jgi:uncharacterized caspase-like protein
MSRNRLLASFAGLFVCASVACAQTPAPDGQSFAILVGISEFQHLPREQWLQYAHADAETFARLLQSPRGGGLPAANVVLMTNKQATTQAVRRAFADVKSRAGKKDTIVVMIAGHGAVESAGDRAAYILTNDSDPQDMKKTALPMAEIQTFIGEGLTRVARMLVFVDVCRAGNIGSISNAAVNGAVEKLGDAEGDILGLMASRPREVSYEGPEYGGGHGAFSYYLLKALSGEADKDGDKIVTASEVIDYVQEKVKVATRDRQHPREFGTLDNATVMADANKPGIDPLP